MDEKNYPLPVKFRMRMRTHFARELGDRASDQVLETLVQYNGAIQTIVFALNVSSEPESIVSIGNIFHIRIVRQKKLYLYASECKTLILRYITSDLYDNCTEDGNDIFTRLFLIL